MCMHVFSANYLQAIKLFKVTFQIVLGRLFNGIILPSTKIVVPTKISLSLIFNCKMVLSLSFLIILSTLSQLLGLSDCQKSLECLLRSFAAHLAHLPIYFIRL